jgi:PAS domain S-box-containing protein
MPDRAPFSSRLFRWWNSMLLIGFDQRMDQTQQTRLFAVNAFLCISLVLTVLFIVIFVSLGSYSALQGLALIPILLLIFYFNSKKWFRASRIMVSYGLMILALILALSDRRTGTEYILIAIGCCSVVIYDKIGSVISSFLFAFSCYIIYTWYDSYYPFIADPSVPYLLSQNALMFLSGFAVLSQSMVFRWLINDYAAKLKSASKEIQTVNEELRASNEELKAFSENLDLIVRQKSAQLQAYHDAINMNTLSVTLNHRGIFLAVNEPLLAVSGYTREELIGQHYKMFNTDQFTNEQLQARYVSMAAGNTWSGELRYKTKSGLFFWIDCVIMPIKGIDGSIAEFLSMGILITQRKELEEKNVSAIQALEDVARKTSHDIRGPLARMTGLTSLLLRDMVEKDELVYVAKKMIESTAELDSATHDLTAFVNKHQKLIINRNKED